MKIDIKEISHGSSWNGKMVWICDYRRPDLDKKPIRHVEPTQVLVRSNTELPDNKRIYYSENHFVKLNAKGLPTSNIIPVFDNTGYRSNSGVPLMAFDNEEECNAAYCEQSDQIIKELDKKIETIVNQLQNEKISVIENKTKYL